MTGDKVLILPLSPDAAQGRVLTPQLLESPIAVFVLVVRRGGLAIETALPRRGFFW